MASILLGTLASAVGSTVASPLGGFITSQLTQMAGSAITGAIMGKPAKRHSEGARLEELAVQTSTYGRAIASFFGTVRLAGNVIWSLPIKEVATTSSVRSGGKGGGRRQSVSQTTYSYFVTLAIAIGEGPITRLERVWADAKLLDLSQGTYRIYHGHEDQMPDSLIESIEGVGRTPAYRGLSYVVIEDFPLAAFGNRIPNFSFEVTRDAVLRVPERITLEEQIKSIVLLPGSGEYVYDTVIAQKSDGQMVGSEWAAQGYRRILNANTSAGKADVLVAILQMLDALPNLEWVSVVVNWFGTSMDLPSCEVMPCVEYQTATLVSPHPWAVAGYSRSTARLIGYESGRPRYGGTPDDGSLVRLCDHLRARGLKVMFLPLMLMDVAGKPWRGELTGAPSDIANFFTKTNGYNRYILHYAHLLYGKVDAFAIGSEMKALNAVTSGAGVFPAVSQFVNLAASVKTILGTSVKVTYAADWSEYHTTTGGWYHMDPLWASSNIDVIGIDAYFPLTDEPQPSITREKIVDGWTSGEGYDWFYSDVARTVKTPLAAPYAWKNLAWWWNNTHTNPGGATTAWTPASKPIWFTEIGYASVDGTTNEPNVFIDPTSTLSDYPRFSRRRVDVAAQRIALQAAFEQWGTSSMIEELFIWGWDARPYPAWPDLRSVWADGGNWKTGHWIQGKIGRTQLAAIVEHILLAIGILPAQLDVSQLTTQVDGVVMNQRVTARAFIEQLQTAYAFDLRESEGRIIATTRDRESLLSISEQALIPQQEEDRSVMVRYQREEERMLPARLEVRYLDRFADYGTSVQAAVRAQVQVVDTEMFSSSLVMSESSAQLLAQRLLMERWLGRELWQFDLPMAYSYLEAGDIITLTTPGYSVPLMITRLQLGKPGMLKLEGVLHQRAIYDMYVAPKEQEAVEPNVLQPTFLHVLDMPALPLDGISDHGLRFALIPSSANWPGAVVLRGLTGSDTSIAFSHNGAAITGTTLAALPEGIYGNVIDEVSTVEINLDADAQLSNITEEQLLAGANAAMIGDEMVQFTNVTVLSPGRVRISRLLRGRMGTEWAQSSHSASERFVLINDALYAHALTNGDIGRTIRWLCVTSGLTELEATERSALYLGRALMPYAPVHLRAEKNAAAGIEISWIRRSRIEGDLRDLVDVALNESSERYALEIWQGVTLLRTVELTTPYFTYTQAMQLADTGAAITSFTLKLWQISALVGRGYETSASFTFSW